MKKIKTNDIKAKSVSVRLPLSVVQKIDKYKEKKGYTCRGQALVDLSVRAELRDKIVDFIEKETDITMKKMNAKETWNETKENMQKIEKRDGIFEFWVILNILDAFSALTWYADKIFDYLQANKGTCFADEVRLANFGNKAYELLKEFNEDNEAAMVYEILGLNPDDIYNKNVKNKKVK